jgi:hypothetical protein
MPVFAGGNNRRKNEATFNSATPIDLRIAAQRCPNLRLFDLKTNLNPRSKARGALPTLTTR